jgi:hypothetical protein
VHRDLTLVAIAHFLLAVASLAQAAPGASPSSTRAVAYKSYKGDGTVARGWPDVSKWSSFDSM